MNMQDRRLPSAVFFDTIFDNYQTIQHREATVMDRVFNFSPGPAVMPEQALSRAAQEMLCYGSTGVSVMEMSHRSKMYLEIFDGCVALVRELMSVPDDYAVLMLQGGATAMFSAVPMNLMTSSGRADYVDSGSFAHIAMVEASKYGTVNCVASSKPISYTRIPALDSGKFDPGADYFYVCTNNTIYGTRFTEMPDTGAVPLVADMSSNILSETYDVSKFGLIFAGAQKNIGPAGLTLVIVKRSLLGKAMDQCPKIMNLKLQDENDSMINTPSTYSIYMAKLCLEWLKEQGGVPAMERINIEKANLLYDCLDNSKLFRAIAEPPFRSRMNAVFTTGDADKDEAFIKYAQSQGLINLKGHRSVGGMRASIYNAMPVAGVKKLVEAIKDYEEKNA